MIGTSRTSSLIWTRIGRIKAAIPRIRAMFATFFTEALRDDIEVYVDQYREAFIPISVSLTTPLPGLRDVLALLSPRMKLAIATSRTVRGARHILDDMDLTHHFTTIVGIEDVEESKPHPQPVRLALERLRISPEHAVMVGDTVDDMLAGRSAGAKTVGIAQDDGRRKELKKAGAHYIIEQLCELTRIVYLDSEA